MVSGMNGSSFAEQLISAERMGKDQLYKSRMTQHQTQLDAYAVLEKSLNQMSRNLEKLDGDAFDGKTSSISDDNASITVESDAPTGSYDLCVKQMAQAHQISKGFSGEDALLPTSGVLTIQVGPNAADTMALDMAVCNPGGVATVADLTDMINKHSDNPGVQASLVRTGGQVELMLSSKETGVDSSIDVKMNGANWGVTERRAAQDAELTLNGIDIKSSSNNLNNVIDGVSIELNKIHAAGESSAIKIEADTDANEQAVEDYVDSFNELMTEIGQLTRSLGSSVLDDIKEDKDKDTDKDKDEDEDKDDGPSSVTEDQLGALKGDSSIRRLQNGMRNAIFEPASNGMRLADIGIEINREGKLEIDKDKLTKALKDDPDAVEAMFTGTGNYVHRMDKLIDPFTKSSGGYIDLRQENLDKQISQVEDNMSRHDHQMKQRYQIYLAQFTAMEATINQLNSASALFNQGN